MSRLRLLLLPLLVCIPAALAAPPAVGPAPPLSLPTPQVYRLSDGTPVWVLARPELPLVHLELSLRGGLLDAADPAALALAAELLEEGAGELRGPAWADAVEASGTRVHVGLSALRTQVAVEALAGHEAEALALVRMALTHPRLPRRDLRRVRRAAVEQARLAWLAPARLHELAVQRTLYAPEHPLGRVSTTAALRGAGRARVRRAWKVHLALAPPAVVVVGATTAERVLPLLEQALVGLPGAGPAVPLPPLDPPVRGPRRVLVDLPGAGRAMLSVLLPVPGVGHPDQPALELLTRALAADFDSRLSRLLRQERGWTYVVQGNLRLWPGHGVLELRCAVDPEVVPEALAAIAGELQRLAEQPPSGEELRRVQAGLRRDAALALLDESALAASLAARQAWDLAPGSAALEVQAALALDDAGIARVARSLPVAWAVEVITGDRARVEPAMEAAGLALDSLHQGRAIVDGRPPRPL